ncbi:hypothetical protein QZH41_009901 [Actinostola sp. cb2023]|nr:hypothetical protein QZH41_009901 [Actinostola sp. cb2023]
MASNFTEPEETPDFDVGFDFLDERKENIHDNEKNVNETTVSKKARFAELETKDLDDIVASAPCQSTKYATKWGISVFKEWHEERKIETKIEDMETAKVLRRSTKPR